MEHKARTDTVPGFENTLTLRREIPVRFPVNLSIVLPAFNEAANLAAVTESAVAFLRESVENFEIIIVNDGSTDGTGELIRTLAWKHPEVRGIEHPVNSGYGACLRNGFASSRYEWLFFTDSDHQFRIDSLLELLPLRKRPMSSSGSGRSGGIRGCGCSFHGAITCSCG
ncbi:MAG: glycosyltransferase family 2 protein [Candidatus Omnitrophica bacterium]|nr:glycosyltransferase family 2 protein [Candidatus Omnitrophota bacterium]